MEALATLANSKANLPGKPYAFIPYLWACDSQAAMLNCWKAAAVGTPGGVVIRCDLMAVYRFTGSDYKQLSSWTVQANWQVVDSTVNVTTIPGAAGEFLFKCSDSPISWQGDVYRWNIEAQTPAWVRWTSLAYSEPSGLTGASIRREGTWLGEFARLRSNITKSLYGSSGNPLTAAGAWVEVVRDGETFQEYQEVSLNKVFETKPYAFTASRFPQLPVFHFSDIQAVFPISGAVNPKLVTQWTYVVADVLPTGTEFTWLSGNGYTVLYAHKRIEIHLKGNFGWMGITGRLQVDLGLTVAYGTIPSGRTSRFLPLTDPDPIFTAGDSRGLGTTAHVVPTNTNNKAVCILADVQWNGNGDLVLWAELDPASDIWFFELPWIYEGPNYGTFRIEFDVTDKAYHIHNTAQLASISLPVNPVTQGTPVTIWSKFWDVYQDDHFDNRDPAVFTWLQTSGRVMLSMEGITGGCWYAKPRPLTGVSPDKLIVDWVRDEFGQDVLYETSLLRRYANYYTLLRNINTPDHLTVTASEMQVSRMIGWGFPKCFVRSYDDTPNTCDLQQSHPNPRIDAYYPKFSVIIAVMIKKLNWDHVFQGAQQHVGDPTYYLDTTTVDIGFVQNGTFLTLQTVTLDEHNEVAWIYPHWINFTHTALTYRARSGTTKVKADVQAIIVWPDPKLLGEDSDMPAVYGILNSPGAIGGMGTPIMAFHYNDTVRLLDQLT